MTGLRKAVSRPSVLVAAAAALVLLVVLVTTRGGGGDARASRSPVTELTGEPTPSAPGSAAPTATPSGGSGSTTSSYAPATPATRGGEPPPAALPSPRYTPQQVANQQAKPGVLPMRFDMVSNAGWLASPGLAISSGSVDVTALQPFAFTSLHVKRPVDITGGGSLRLHLTHSGSGDIPLQVEVSDVDDAGAVRVLATKSFTVPASVATAGPKSNADTALSLPAHRLQRGHALRVTLSLAPTSVDRVSVFYGALPGEADGNSNQDQLARADGGANPARLMLPVADVNAAFSPAG